MAKMIVDAGMVNFSNDERGKILVTNMDGKTKYRVDVPRQECECGRKNCAHLRAALYQLGFADDFSTPPKLRQRPAPKPKFRRAKGVKSGRKAPRTKDTVKSKRKPKSRVDDFLPMRATVADSSEGDIFFASAVSSKKLIFY